MKDKRTKTHRKVGKSALIAVSPICLARFCITWIYCFQSTMRENQVAGEERSESAHFTRTSSLLCCALQGARNASGYFGIQQECIVHIWPLMLLQTTLRQSFNPLVYVSKRF
jgi:hypothetical protein